MSAPQQAGGAAPPDDAADGGDERRHSLGVEVLILLGIAVLIAVGIRTFVAQAFSIPSPSMVPQLEEGDRVIVSRIAYRLHDQRRGDVIVFHCPPAAHCPNQTTDDPALPVRALRGALEAVGLRQPSTDEFIKRVIALPGETVEGKEGSVFVEGRRLIEPYLPPGTPTSDFAPVQVPAGHVWVMGDNRGNSQDSRMFGAVDIDTIVGRAFVRAWPPGRVAFL